jgi:hypothetical protein
MERSADVEARLAELRGSTYLAQMRELVESASHAALQFRPAPQEWSIVQILRHLGDTEELRHLRFNRMLAENNPYLVRVDPTPGERETEDALHLLDRYERLRNVSVQRLSAMSEAEWRRPGTQGPDPQVNRTADEETTVLKESGKVDLHASRHLVQMQDNLKAMRSR